MHVCMLQGGNPYVTPDSTVHDQKMADVEMANGNPKL